MPDTVQAISRSLSNDVDALSTISHNVANINTPAFRAVRGTSDFRASIDQQDGAVAQTEGRFDLALRGPGFFVVERDGKPLLTRAGAFRLDAEGMLVTAGGDRVAGSVGAIATTAKPVRIDAKGGLWDGQQSLGQLQIVNVTDAAGLRPAGNGAYAYDGELGEWTGSVVQGALERANVDAAEETVRLMETTRHAEAVQRAISIYDKAMDVGINRLGDN